MPETFVEEIGEAISKELEKIAQAKTQPVHYDQAKIQPVQNDKVHTNNCWGNMDYSPLAPTDTLNAKVSPAMAGALTGSAITVAAAPAAAPLGVSLAISQAIASDLAEGRPSFSASITGHHGETFGHFDFPH